MPEKDNRIEVNEIEYVARELLKNLYYLVTVIILVFFTPFLLSYFLNMLGGYGLPEEFELYISIAFYISVGVISIEFIRKMISNSLREVLDEYSVRGVTSFSE